LGRLFIHFTFDGVEWFKTGCLKGVQPGFGVIDRTVQLGFLFFDLRFNRIKGGRQCCIHFFDTGNNPRLNLLDILFERIALFADLLRIGAFFCGGLCNFLLNFSEHAFTAGIDFSGKSVEFSNERLYLAGCLDRDLPALARELGTDAENIPF